MPSFYLKPENLLLTTHDLNFIGSDKAGVRLKLADFGLAYQMKEDEPKLYTVCGKCGFEIRSIESSIKSSKRRA